MLFDPPGQRRGPPSARPPPGPPPVERRRPMRPATHGCDHSKVTENPASSNVTAADEVVSICRDLIRIDTTNPGDHSGPGERQAAEHVAALLSEAGLESRILEARPGRASVV